MSLSAQDPTETWVAQDFCSAKALFVPSLKRDIVPLLHAHDLRRVAWQSTSDGANSYSHWAAQQLRGRWRRARSCRNGCDVSACLWALLKAIRRDSLALSRSARRCKT